MSEHDPIHLLEELQVEETARPAWQRHLQTLVVIIVAALLLWWCFSQVELEKMLAELERANIPLFIAAVSCGHISLYLVQMFAVYASLRAVGFSGKLRPFFLATSALQLPGAVQVHLASAGLVAYNKRRHGLPIASTAAAAMFVYFSDASIFALAIGAAGRAVGGPYATYLPVFGAGLIAMQLFAVAYLRGRFDFILPRFAIKPREWGLLRPLTQITAKTWGRLVAMRLLVFAAMALPSAVGLRAFGVDVPIGFLAAAIPLGQFLGNVPVAFGGFGTTQAVMLKFLGPYGTREAILAWSLCWTVGLILCRATQGALFFKHGVNELLAKEASEPVTPGPKSESGVPIPDPAVSEE
ncbi:MAG: flippase-like domain-containing protein [Chrysiogenetes bacterium]|nr:flippase-like domain-containing protein [Chrysiogenetes bacterium]